MGRINNDAYSSVPDFTALDYLFLETTLPVPDLECSVLTVHMSPYTIEAIEGHKREPGKPHWRFFRYHFLVKEKPSNLGIWRKVNVVPQCHEMIRAYRSRILAEDPHAFDPPKIQRVSETSLLSRPDTSPSTTPTPLGVPCHQYRCTTPTTLFFPAGFRSSIVRR